MKWTATKVTTAATATKATSSVVTRAGSDTGYHLVSLLPPMHTVAAAAALLAAWRPTGSFGRSPQARCRVTHPMVTAKRIRAQQGEP